MFDPFAYYEIVEAPTIDEEMIIVPMGEKVFGIDEGLFIGIILGFILCDMLGDL